MEFAVLHTPYYAQPKNTVEQPVKSKLDKHGGEHLALHTIYSAGAIPDEHRFAPGAVPGLGIVPSKAGADKV